MQTLTYLNLLLKLNKINMKHYLNKRMENITDRARNDIELFDVYDFQMNRIVLQMQCLWCQSIATKIVELGPQEEKICCDKCAKNIESFKERFCANTKTQKYCWPIVLDNKKQLCENFFINNTTPEKGNYKWRRQCHSCNICKKYMRALLFGHETNFLKIDFYGINEIAPKVIHHNDSDFDSDSDDNDIHFYYYD